MRNRGENERRLLSPLRVPLARARSIKTLHFEITSFTHAKKTQGNSNPIVFSG